MNKVTKEKIKRQHVIDLHEDYVKLFCKGCTNPGCHSEDLKNGTATIRGVAIERAKKYGYEQSDKEIRDDYECFL